jgi:DNA invertase Pin-like site-specific DNA recombinase
MSNGVPLPVKTRRSVQPADDDLGTGLTAVIYIRVSTKEQAERDGDPEGYSIPAQREACRRKATNMGAVIIEEFVDRGESAKTANRPELQRMLAFVSEQRVSYVIVHKVDRLARSRADDVAINLALKQCGVELVSVSENIDQTPSGLLLHGIMSSIAEFYSRNLANEVIKGSVEKAKQGGTPGRAPVGYRNVRSLEGGRDVRSIEVDPERAALITWAFETYATGDWTVRNLAAELAKRGLVVSHRTTQVPKPLGVSHLHKQLRNPYYMGLVRYRGVLYPGKHEPIVTPDTWYRVQDLLAAKNLAGEKQREHPHYLRGTIYCGRCGARLLVCHAKGRHGGVYPYFICSGRQRDKASCMQRAIRIEEAEERIAAYYGTHVQLTVEEATQVREFLTEELSKLRASADRERRIQTRRLVKLQAERKKLLDAHYADAIPLELLKSEQTRISSEIRGAEERLLALAADSDNVERNLYAAIALVGDCERAYREAPARVRRRFNQAFFRQILIDDEYTVTGEYAEPFDVLLGDDLLQAAAARSTENVRTAVEEALRQREGAECSSDDQRPRGPELVLVGAEPTSTPILRGRGFSQEHLVRMRGLEPPPDVLRHGPGPNRGPVDASAGVQYVQIAGF